MLSEKRAVGTGRQDDSHAPEAWSRREFRSRALCGEDCLSAGTKPPAPRTAYRNVASMTALIECRRFSASSKTRLRGPSKTSSVTSSSARPNFW